MVPEYLHGAIAPVYTVFDETGAFSEDGQRRFFDFLSSMGGINAYFVRSGLGQMYAYSYDESRAMARVACEYFSGRAPVFVGATGVWDRNFDKRPDPAVFLDQAISLSLYAQECGASAVVHTLPEAILPQGNESYGDVVLRYFETICGAVSIPVIAYQPPTTAEQYCLTPELLTRLAEMHRLVAAKISTLNAEYLFNLAWAARGKCFTVIAGCETVYYTALCMGINATIGQGCTTNPHIIRAVEKRFLSGDRVGAMAAQHSVNRLVSGMRNITEFTKRYACERGYPVPVYTRRFEDHPYMTNQEPLTEHEYKSLKTFFEQECAKYA